ncbi:MAG: hypothetical protein J1E02_03630 [Coprobacter sp.]|nr:hypothetical protein [Coprobacter sp.]
MKKEAPQTKRGRPISVIPVFSGRKNLTYGKDKHFFVFPFRRPLRKKSGREPSGPFQAAAGAGRVRNLSADRLHMWPEIAIFADANPSKKGNRQ